MREIIFRAKRKDTGEWVESGSIMRTKNDDGQFEYFIGAHNPGVYCSDNQGNLISATTMGDAMFYGIDPDTFGQFTGLTDKNGNRIFEGDILKGKPKYYYTVEYSQNIAGFMATCAGAQSTPCMNYGTLKHYEVVGNKWDNPELLEE